MLRTLSVSPYRLKGRGLVYDFCRDYERGLQYFRCFGKKYAVSGEERLHSLARDAYDPGIEIIVRSF